MLGEIANSELWFVPEGAQSAWNSITATQISYFRDEAVRLHKPVTDWLETLPHGIYGLNL